MIAGTEQTLDFEGSVIKADGRREPFVFEKLHRSLVKSGVDDEVSAAVEAELASKLYDGIPTRQIRTCVLNILNRRAPDKVRAFRKEGELYVRTSKSTIERFDKTAIVDSLVAEAGMEKYDAKKIARRAETRLRAMAVDYISSPLVRETVCMVLLEEGLEDVRLCYTRLGMPVADMTRLIEQGSKDNANLHHNPETVHKFAGDQILREYLFVHCMPHHITDAHLRGEIHLHDADYYAVRPNCLQHDLSWFFRNGLRVDGTGDHTSAAAPPKHAMVAVLQAAKILAASQTNMAGGQSFDNFNIFMSPFVVGMNDDETKQIAQCFVYELNQQYVARGGQSLGYDSPLVLRKDSNIEITSIGDFCHRYLNDDGIVEIPSGYETPSLNRETGKIEWKPVTGVAVHVPATKIVSVRLHDGRSVVATSDHSLFAIDADANFVEAKPGSRTILTAHKISNDIGESQDSAWRNVVHDRAWTVGVMIGDGNMLYYKKTDTEPFGLNISVSSEEVANRFASLAKTLYGHAVTPSYNGKGCYTVRVQSPKIVPYFDVGRHSHNKHIPAWVLSESDSVLMSLLDGLLSTDGNLSRGRYEYTTTSKTLVGQLEYVLNRLGFRYNVQTRNGATPFRRNHVVYRLQICTDDSRRIVVTNPKRVINADGPCGPCQNMHNYEAVRDMIKKSYGEGVCYLSYALRSNGRKIKREDLMLVRDKCPELVEKLENVLPSEVESVSDAEYDRPYVYDICVRDNENFVLANGIIAHNTVFSSINLDLSIPKFMADLPAVGPGGKAIGTYSDYYEESLRFTGALLDVFLDGDARGKPHLFPNTIIKARPDAFKRPEQRDIMLKTHELFAKYGTPYIANICSDWQHDSVAYMGCRTRTSGDWADKRGYANPLESTIRCGNIHYNTVNLPRIAIEAGGDDAKAISILDDRMDLIMDSLLVKHDIITRRLYNNHVLPFLSQDGVDEHGRRGMYYRFDDLTHTLGFVGLNEYVKHITGADLHSGGYNVGLSCVKHMREWADRLADETGWRWTLTQTPAETTAGRFALLDMQEYGDRAIVNGDRKSGAVYYTNSSHLKVDAPTPIYERAKLEGKFHPLCNGGHIAHFFLGEGYPDPEALLSLTEKLCRNTDAGLFDYTKDLSVCKNCATTTGGLVDKCPTCGATGASLEYYSRITGYCQRIGTGSNQTGGWNAYKQAELRDRHRHCI